MQKDWDDISATAHLWRSRKQEGLSAQEQAEFQAWYEKDPAHGAAYADAVLLWESAGKKGYAEKLQAVIAELDAEDQEASDHSEYKGTSWLGRALTGVTALAAAVAAAVFFGLPGNLGEAPNAGYERFANDGATTKSLTLPDRSRITLGPSSVIELALLESERRARLLEGDAFFRVQSNKNRPFSVETEHGYVVVTGTTFDLQLSKADLSVGVGQGSVRVERATQDKEQDQRESVVLSAGELVTVSRAKGFSEIREIFSAELAPWRSGLLVYQSTPLSDVVTDLNRYSDRPITLDAKLNGLTLNGTFKANDLEFLFDSMRASLPVRITDEGEKIVISSM